MVGMIVVPLNSLHVMWMLLLKDIKIKLNYGLHLMRLIQSLDIHFMTGGLIESRFKPEEFEEVEYQAMHHQFVASDLATKNCA